MISFYISSSTDPYENLALEEVLISQAKKDQIILYLWQNDHTVVIGRNQNAWRECRLEAFAREKGKLMRRMTGGGAVYQDMGNQNFTFIAPTALYDLDKQMEVIRRAVATFNIEAKKKGRNDILVGDKKFSGNAFRHTNQISVQHGTILISTDMSKLSRFLKPSKEKLASKGIESVRSRVINLCELNPVITPDLMRHALLKAFEEVYQAPLYQIQNSEINHEQWVKLTTKFSDDEWCLGPVSNFDYEFRHRFSFGELEFKFSIEKGRIIASKIYSDALDADWILSMETAFLNIPFTTSAMAAALPESQNLEHTSEVLEFLKHLEL